MKLSLDKINDLFTPKARLGIMTILAKEGRVDFKYLKSALGLTDGNLGAHLKKLSQLDFILQEKVIEKNKPKSYYEITSIGRETLIEHISYLEEIIRMIQE